MKHYKKMLGIMAFLAIAEIAVGVQYAYANTNKPQIIRPKQLITHDLGRTGFVTEFVTNSGVHCIVTTSAHRSLDCDFSKSIFHDGKKTE